MEALASSRFRAKVEIVVGFAVAAVGAIIGLASWAFGGNLAYSSRFDIEECVSVLAFLFTVVAWFFLTQLTVGASGAQRVPLRRALACFAFEEACVAVSSLSLSLGALRWIGPSSPTRWWERERSSQRSASFR